MVSWARESSAAGYLRDRYPCYRFGDGEQPLVVVPGLSDAFAPVGVSRTQAMLYEYYYFRHFTDDLTIYVLGRPHGLPAGYSTREMAAAYADAIDALGFDSVPCLGISMGGLIAQHLAADFDCVSRLVCSVSGCRLGADGRETIHRWRDWAARGEWFRAVVDGVPVSYTGPRRWLYPPVLRAIGPLLPAPAAEADIVTACEACLAHDFGGSLDSIEVPTLVIGGADDHLFPAPILEETATGIPDSRLELAPEVGHGGYEERPRAWSAPLRAFLSG